VKPRNKIINYLTQHSGITKQLLADVTTTIEDVQKSIQELLPSDAILIGHSLNCDLKAINVSVHIHVITKLLDDPDHQYHLKFEFIVKY